MTCAPASRAGRARRSDPSGHPRRRAPRPPRRSRRRTRSTDPTGSARRRRAGRRTRTPRRGASGGAAGPSPEPESSRNRSSEVVAHLLRAHRHHAGGGQLDGEGDAVEPLADRGDRGGFVGIVEREAGLHRLGSLDEELHGGCTGAGLGVEGWDRPHVLGRKPQPLTAGGQDLHGGRRRSGSCRRGRRRPTARARSCRARGADAGPTAPPRCSRSPTRPAPG